MPPASKLSSLLTMLYSYYTFHSDILELLPIRSALPSVHHFMICHIYLICLVYQAGEDSS